jgi:L-malate glycosyltransferase
VRIFHVTNWFCSKDEPTKAIWIKNHIQALDKYAEQEVLHAEVRYGKSFSLRKEEIGRGWCRYILYAPFEKFFIIEVLNFLLLSYLILLKFRTRHFDVVNFHIAYPQLTYIHLIKGIFKGKPVFVTEHWSAYHFNFNVAKQSKLKRIKRIFKNDIHWITVSESLKQDIIEFSDLPNLSVSVVPNVVDTFLFQLPVKENRSRLPITTFFMVSNWKWPKLPILLLQAFKDAIDKGMVGVLRIGGFGPEWATIEKYILDHDLLQHISLLGPLSPLEIAKEMQFADAYVHCSEYETFSVVCAEALCCGTPVIASKVGAIPEFVDSDSGILIDDDLDQWVKALLAFSRSDFNSVEISQKASAKFSSQAVGRKYSNVLSNVKG